MAVSKQRLDNPWIARIKKGDVLKAPSGLLRVVRDVSHHHVSGYGIRTCVVFAIRHCSWTHRPTTVLTGNDLVQMGYRPTKGRVSLRKKIDKLIERDYSGRIVALRGGEIGCYPLIGSAREIDCCDVRGIA